MGSNKQAANENVADFGKRLEVAKVEQETIKGKLCRADEMLKERRSDMAQVRKSEAAAQQHLDKSERAQLIAQNHSFGSENDAKNTEESAKSFLDRHQDSVRIAQKSQECSPALWKLQARLLRLLYRQKYD